MSSKISLIPGAIAATLILTACGKSFSSVKLTNGSSLVGRNEAVADISDSSGTSKSNTTSSEVLVSGRYFVDKNNKVIRLRSMNWDGFNDRSLMLHGLDIQQFDTVVELMKQVGINSIRLPFANEMLSITQPKTSEAVLLRHPYLRGLTPKQAFVEMVRRLTNAGLYVILDNHQTTIDYYGENEGDGLWFSESFSERQWLEDWSLVAQLFQNNSRVIGYELRNEVRAAILKNGTKTPEPKWGGGGAYDWRRAQILAAKKIWSHNSKKIIFLSGVGYNFYIGGAYYTPISPIEVGQTHPHFAYSVHIYGWYEDNQKVLTGRLHQLTKEQQYEVYGRNFGFAIVQNQTFTAPVWVSEFGVSNLYNTANDATEWQYWYHFHNLIDYLNLGQISYGYYTLSSYYTKNTRNQSYDCRSNISEYYQSTIYSNGSPVFGKNHYEIYCNTYGILTPGWDALASGWRVSELRRLLQ
ncbi:MAG: cellulase family glycosylhydrolase [Bdellovibrionales bacterium]|nr:cellulase family glycosylhydrolase [Bdellovibrionales bacterium]